MSQSKREHLLIIVNTSRFFLSHRRLLAQGAMAHGYQVTVASPLDAESEKIKQLGFAHYPINMGRKSMNPFGELVTIWHFVRALSILKPDIVHLFTIKPVLYGALSARLHRIPKIVVTITGLGFLFLKEGLVGDILRLFVGTFYKLVIRTRKIKVIFQNQDDHKLFTERHWVLPEQAKIIYGTGVDTNRFQPTQKSLVKNNGHSQLVNILFPARFLKDKGIFELVEAGRILSAQKLNFKILLCGGTDPGNPSSISINELKEIETNKFIKNLGYSENMPEVFKLADIVCLPSYREGIPLSLLEAAACGLAIVTTDAPGCREVVEHNKNGFLAEVKNSSQLAKFLSTLILDENLRRKMGEISRERARKFYSTDVVIKQNLDCYRD